jgi:glycosyltransferase involved in cell wall biosynthesis
VLVLPYRSGSQSAVAPLALSRGVPVLTTDVGALAEVVEHGRNGVVIEPGSADALAEALQQLDEERLRRLAGGARESAARLSWASYAEAFENLARQVLQ